MTTTTIAPFLSVRRGAAAVAFYKAAFGAAELFTIESPTGDVVAQLAVEGAGFWVSDESPEHGNFSPETLNGGTTRMVLTIADPDATVRPRGRRRRARRHADARTTTAGTSAASSIPSAITGRSASRSTGSTRTNDTCCTIVSAPPSTRCGR